MRERPERARTAAKALLRSTATSVSVQPRAAWIVAARASTKGTCVRVAAFLQPSNATASADAGSTTTALVPPHTKEKQARENTRALTGKKNSTAPREQQRTPGEARTPVGTATIASTRKNKPRTYFAVVSYSADVFGQVKMDAIAWSIASNLTSLSGWRWSSSSFLNSTSWMWQNLRRACGGGYRDRRDARTTMSAIVWVPARKLNRSPSRPSSRTCRQFVANTRARSEKTSPQTSLKNAHCPLMGAIFRKSPANSIFSRRFGHPRCNTLRSPLL